MFVAGKTPPAAGNEVVYGRCSTDRTKIKMELMKKKKTADRMIDIHSHLIYGVDDGASDMEETLDMLRTAALEGITDIIATPHFKEGRRNASPETLRKHLEEIRQEIVKQNVPITLYLGHEFHFSSNAEELLEQKKVLTLNDSEYVLTEFLPYENFTYMRNGIDCIMGMGYVPVLAHAERYECLLKDAGNIRELRDMGSRIQVNGSSVTGEAGSRVKKFVHALLKGRLIDYVATDAHGSVERKPEMKRCCEYLYKKYDQSYVDAILFRNAEGMI